MKFTNCSPKYSLHKHEVTSRRAPRVNRELIKKLAANSPKSGLLDFCLKYGSLSILMTPPLREYLAQRRADIQAQIKAFRKELAEIDAAEAALDAVSDAPKPRRVRGGSDGKPTLKELALEALSANNNGLEASAILAWIAEKHGLEIARESMSPQLSRLAQDGEIVRLEGGIWQLKWVNEIIGGPAPVEDETPDVAASGASENGPVLSDRGPFQ